MNPTTTVTSFTYEYGRTGIIHKDNDKLDNYDTLWFMNIVFKHEIHLSRKLEERLSCIRT